MRILLLTQFFQPEPFLKGIPFAQELIRRGHQVQVLTGFPNYPNGKLYDGYRVCAFQREVVEGIPIIRVPLYPSHDRSALRRVINYASFMASAGTLGLYLTDPVDVVYVYQMSLAGIVFKWLRRTPFVLDIQDLWPDALQATRMITSPTLLRTVARVAKFTYARASRVVVLSEGFKTALVNRGVPIGKVVVIHNWALDSEEPPTAKDPQLAERAGLSGRFNIVFAGNFGLAQALDTILDTAALLKDSFSNVQFVLMGTGVEAARLHHRVEAEGLTNVRFLGWQQVETAKQILAIADALLVHLKDEPLFRITIPSKTQSYLAAGRPILMAVRGDAASLVQRANAGLAIPPQDPRALADATVALYSMAEMDREQLGRNGRTYYEGTLSLRAGVDKFASVFETAIKFPIGKD